MVVCSCVKELNAWVSFGQQQFSGKLTDSRKEVLYVAIPNYLYTADVSCHLCQLHQSSPPPHSFPP